MLTNSAQIMKSRIVGVNLFNHSGYFYDIMHGVDLFVRRYADWRVVVDAHSRQSHPVDGVLSFLPKNDAARFAMEKGIPLVVTSNSADQLSYPVVCTDDRRVGEMAAEHLLQCGYEHFAIPAMHSYRAHRIRFEALRDRLAREGRSLHLLWDRNIDPYEPCIRNKEIWQTIIRAALDAPKPLGIYSSEELNARLLLESLIEAGVRIPEEIGLLATNNGPEASYFGACTMSSIALNGQEVGYRAAETLERMMNGEDVPITRLEVPPLEVIGRQSTDYVRANHPAVARALRFIHNAYSQPIDVPAVTAECGLGRRQFETLFRRQTGKSPHRYLLDLRLERARNYLRSTKWPVQQIARSCGFKEARIFTIAFKREIGIAPTRWRAQHGLSRRVEEEPEAESA